MESYTKTKIRNLTLLLASTLTIMASAIIAPALPAMEAHFPTTPFSELLIKMTLTVPALMIVVSAPIAGVLFDTLPKIRVLVFSLLLYGVAGSAAYFIPDNLSLILASRVVLGIAVAGVMVGCTALIGDYFDGQERHRYMGYMAAFGSFGGVVFLVVGGLLAEVSWRLPFLIYLVSILLLPAVFCFLSNPKQHQTVVNEKLSQGGEGVAASRTLILICYLVAFIEITGFYVIPIHLPFYLDSISDGKHVSSLSGLVIGSSMLVTAIVAMNYPRIKAKLSYSGITTVGLALLAIGLLLTSWGSNVYQIGLSLMISGVGVGMIRPNVANWLLSGIAAEHRGRVMGGMTSFLFLGQFVSPLLTQPVLEHFGFTALFQITAAVLFLFVLVFVAVMVTPVANRLRIRADFMSRPT